MGWAPAYLIQQVGDSIDVVVGLRNPDHPLSAQDWGRRVKGEPLHCGSADPGTQHRPLAASCPVSLLPISNPQDCTVEGMEGGCYRRHKAAPRWSPERIFYLLGSTGHGAGQGQAGMLTAVTASWETGCSHLTPQPCPHLGAAGKMPSPPHCTHHPSPDILPVPPQDTRTGRRDGERQAAETGSVVTSPAKRRLELQYK